MPVAKVAVIRHTAQQSERPRHRLLLKMVPYRAPIIKVRAIKRVYPNPHGIEKIGTIRNSLGVGVKSNLVLIVGRNAPDQFGKRVDFTNRVIGHHDKIASMALQNLFYDIGILGIPVMHDSDQASSVKDVYKLQQIIQIPLPR